MTEDPREELARRVLHSTAVEMLAPAPDAFERLHIAGRRRRNQRRYAAASGVAAVAAAVVALVLVIGSGRAPESTLQPGGGLGNFLAQSTHGRLSVGATIPLGLSTTSGLVGAEAPDGAFFYSPHSQEDNFGRILPGTPGTNIVRVVDGTSAPAIAEHVPGRVVALGADAIDLYVATPTQVIRYSRTTGQEIHVWPLLPRPVNTAQIVLAGRWMYISAGFQCDSCGLENNSLLSINLITGARHVLATDLAPEGIAGDEQYAYYVGGSGGLYRTTPTGHAVRFPYPVVSFSPVVGEFAGKVVLWGGQHVHARMQVFDPGRLRLVTQWPVPPGVSWFDLVPSATGGAFSGNAFCGPGLTVAICARANFIGSKVSRLDLRTGARFNSLRIPQLMFLYGPAPAAVTASGSSYALVRIR